MQGQKGLDRKKETNKTIHCRLPHKKQKLFYVCIIFLLKTEGTFHIDTHIGYDGLS